MLSGLTLYLVAAILMALAGRHLPSDWVDDAHDADVARGPAEGNR